MVLYNFINLKGYKILAPPGPTYWPTSLRKKPDILDIFVSNTPHNLFCATINLLEPCSDHSTVLLTVSASPPIRPSLPKLFHHSTNRLKFHDLVDQNINLRVSLKSPQEIDTVINNLTNVIQSAAWASGPTKIQYLNVTPSVPEHIRFLISNKLRARAAYQRSRLPSHKRIFNNLSNSLKKILAKHKNQSFVNHLSNLSPNNGSQWTATKSLLKYEPPLVPIINPHGGFASTYVEKAELFKEHLTETFTPHPDIQIPSHTDIVNRLLDIPPSIPPTVKHFSPGEVKFAIQKYSLKKSPGFDLITAKVASSILPNTQFGFRSAHSSIHQLHRLVDAISFSLEKKSYCSCVFLDISQAFDRVRDGTSFSGLAKISTGVPQGVSSLLYYTTSTLPINPPLRTLLLRSLPMTRLLSLSMIILT
ncbi:hypothetical protein QTP88_012899 [Uroleucon formosanum]